MQEPEICLESYSFKQLFRLLWASQNHQYICKFQLIPGLNSCARILVILKTQSNRKLAYKFSTLKCKQTWICWTNLLVILLELKASMCTLSFLVVTIKSWRRSCKTSSIEQWSELFDEFESLVSDPGKNWTHEYIQRHILKVYNTRMAHS